MSHDLPEFDALSALYQNDPQAFEDFRRHALREAIEQAPPRHRPALEALLERMEQARQAASSPMEAAVAAAHMMRDSVARLCEAWVDTQHAVAGLQTALLIARLRGHGTTAP